MKPFQIPRWRKRQIRQKMMEQERVTSIAISDMERAMRRAVAYIVDNTLTKGSMPEPTLNEMFGVSEDFYRNVVRSAWRCSEDEQRLQKGKKRLASGLPTGMPRTLRDLESLFRDHRYWPKIMKRSGVLTERLRKAYLQKLRRKFRDLQPQLLDGRISPTEAKEKMMDAWDASKSRVQTIFRTESTKYFAKTQTAFFSSDPAIIGFLYDSIADHARTDICRSRHGLIFRPGTTGPKGLSENTPALHWNCRSHLIALANTPHNRKLLEDPDRDPKNRTLVPLPEGWKK